MLKQICLSAMLLSASAGLWAQKKPKTDPKKTEPKNTPVTPAKADEFSQALGVAIGENLKQAGLSEKDVNFTDLAKAMELAFKNQSPIQNAQAQEMVNKKIQEIQAGKSAEQAKAGKEFLVQNAKNPNVKSLPSGLQYEVLKAGDGARPILSDKVKVHYHGTLIDGKVFDSSVDRGEPISFQLSGVIKGWQEGVALMPVGAKYKLYIPHELAYGERPAGSIPPFSTLIFEVELLGINVD